METSLTSDSSSKKSQQVKKVTKVSMTNVKKLDSETTKFLSSLKEKINKKHFGRKIRDSEIIGIALKKITPEDIKMLQELTYGERDIIAIAHEKYVKQNGRITLNEYLGKLVRGEISVQNTKDLDSGA